MASAPASVKAVADAVEARLADLLDAETARWYALTPDLAWPLDALRRLVLAGGKRLRPSFCHWAFVGAGGDPDDPRVVDAGAAFELLHAFALMHDDVMDDSDTRRGLETIHAEFAAHHAGTAWGGESRRFGEGVAILVGISGELSGNILIEMDKATAHRLSAKMNQEPSEEVNDLFIATIKEFGNLVCGGAVVRLDKLNMDFNLSPPTVILGEHMILALESKTEILLVPFLSELGQIDLNIFVDLKASKKK